MARRITRRVGAAADDEANENARRLVYLAAERTLLLWVRTAATLIVLGFAIERFDIGIREMQLGSGVAEPVRFFPDWLGVVAILAGAALNVAAAVRFARFAGRYARGETEPGPGLTMAICFSVALTILAIVLALHAVAVLGAS